METPTANPTRLEERPARHLPGRVENILRTRLTATQLVRWQPGLVARLVSVLRYGLGILRRMVAARLRHTSKRLVVCESAALGERRIVSVVQFGEQRFLIGCSPSSVTLLARLPDADAGESSALNGSPEGGNSSRGASR